MTITCLVGGKPDHKTQEIPKMEIAYRNRETLGNYDK